MNGNSKLIRVSNEFSRELESLKKRFNIQMPTSKLTTKLVPIIRKVNANHIGKMNIQKKKEKDDIYDWEFNLRI